MQIFWGTQKKLNRRILFSCSQLIIAGSSARRLGLIIILHAHHAVISISRERPSEGCACLRQYLHQYPSRERQCRRSAAARLLAPRLLPSDCSSLSCAGCLWCVTPVCVSTLCGCILYGVCDWTSSWYSPHSIQHSAVKTIKIYI